MPAVRGLISGTVGKKMGLLVVSSKREDGERAYCACEITIPRTN
jgi:hypothetical protein